MKIPPSILEVDVTLWPLEFDFYVQQLVNEVAWNAYEEAVEVVRDLGLDPEQELQRPRCPKTTAWIAEFPALHDDLIGTLTLPRVDSYTGQVYVADWEEAAAWKADIEVAEAALNDTDRWLYQWLEEGREFDYMARQLNLTRRDLVQRITAMNSRIRQQVRVVA